MFIGGDRSASAYGTEASIARRHLGHEKVPRYVALDILACHQHGIKK